MMIRKLTLAATVAGALGAAAFAPNPASAAWRGGGHGGWHGGFHGGWHHAWGGARHYAWGGGWRHAWGRGWSRGGPRFFVGGPYYGYAGSCLVRRWVGTPWGPRLRWVSVC
jgi:hypothetical protein